MSGIQTLDNIDINKQNAFLFNDYHNFIYSAVYGFLFEGLNLRDLEVKYLGNGCQGFFAKNVLNMIGIDTSKNAGNCGRFAGMNVQEVAKDLLSDNDPIINNIGHILSRKNPI